MDILMITMQIPLFIGFEDLYYICITLKETYLLCPFLQVFTRCNINLNMWAKTTKPIIRVIFFLTNLDLYIICKLNK